MTASPPLVVRNMWSTVDSPNLGEWTPSLRVSVVIPARDCQASLDLVLASLCGQTYPDSLTEVVVVDDGSQPPLRLPDLRPRDTRLVATSDVVTASGIAATCNAGVTVSTGEIVLRLDADMVVFPDHVEAHARWHHALAYAVTLGHKRIVDVRPDAAGWPSVTSCADPRAVPHLYTDAQTEAHEYIERRIARTDGLRTADHLAFLAHVGASVGLRRSLFDRAGGYDPALQRGSDTEFGYRLAQAGAVFIPEPAARAWHLGRPRMIRERPALARFSQPFLADVMPHPRWLRRAGGTQWAVPLVAAVVPVDGGRLELVRTVVDALLHSDESDLRVDLVADWTAIAQPTRLDLDDPLIDLRLIAATYRSEPRVRLALAAAESGFPSPYQLRVPATAGLGRWTVPRLIQEADAHQVGLVRVPLPGPGGRVVELVRTAAVRRAQWLGVEPDRAAIARSHGVRDLRPARAGVVDLRDLDPAALGVGGRAVAAGLRPTRWPPAVVEVGGLRSWLRATVALPVQVARRARTVIGELR